ncbi:class I SAM-dependent methyltransferase [Saliphagus infecundisoli]|uniref:Class I SAM-dependent methyltransferase n=1 Tax=Saliphagus infecundisoli TaxID=1849069 RepID=A0ABD5QFQ5_9EURY|nr:class I SAM-dependent methyltransferase [Saliphagus infecundisoli]
MDAEEVRTEWIERSGEYSPDYYAYYGADEVSEAIRERIEERVGSDASVLELGCSSGRHLAHLHDAGFRDLWGVEINETAGDVMREEYPDLAADGSFRFEPIEDVVGGFDDDRFDAVFSVETLQHIHPDDDWVFTEVARIADELVLTAEIEADEDVTYVRESFPLYHRDWRATFTDLGLEEIESAEVGRDTVRAFRSTE